MTLKHSTQLNLLEPTLSAEASLVSRGQSQTLSEEAQKMTAISGRKCSELLRLLGHGSLLEKMCEALLMSPWGSSVASLTWKILATKTKVSLFQLSPSMRSIAGTECFLWRSPDTGAGGTSGLLKKGIDIRENGQPIQIRLVDQVNNPRLWPTPMAHEARLGYQDRTRGKKGTQESLTTVVINKAGGRKATDGQLNPTFCEYLMGYPIGWTDLNVSGTASCLISQCTLDEPSSRPADD